MNQIRNEKGYALLLVMLMVVLFTILGMGLLMMNMNAAKQFNLKEEQVQARHQAEMGVLHYVAQAKELLQRRNQSITNLQESEKLADKVFCSSLNETTKNTEDTYQVNIVNFLSENCLDKGRLKIEINSIGQSIGGTTSIEPMLKKITADFTIDKTVSSDSHTSGEIEDSTIVSAIDYEVITSEGDIQNSDDLTAKRSLHYPENLVTTAGKNKDGDTIVIKQNLRVDGFFHMGTHGCLAVGNDLILNGTIEGKSKNTNEIKSGFYIYVYGDLYIKEDINIKGGAAVYVSGDVIKNGKIVSPKPFSGFVDSNLKDLKHGTCQLPWADKPIYDSAILKIGDEINAIYK